ncbi:uncharacterized protein GGS22DRAFT_193529 [Annulohypoxylon maeteangense]|uniref:uncharacterized protein n=1 Tax=Annulohypoxylon maeteangense TaxID=1927788 RepID=UPI002008ABE4|nr:uncharacterized protein GGS22DRAFT_193529 [Annulohypoxylon maeteangense]KAI0880181.1 hypothetical protein GGS22DRAFT_193529 [Annulohypoxylon maeteangense]
MTFPLSLSLSLSPSQGSLAATILVSTLASYAGLSPPNISTKPAPPTGDMMRMLNITSKRTARLGMAPLGFLALHTSSLVLFYPNIPPLFLRYGAANGLNPELVTWSAATSIPLALILCAGVPLRLGAYSSLGKNFTFDLAEPDGLKTDGIYRYVQHPSYTGIMIILVSNVRLLGRVDGALSCWIPPEWYSTLRTLGWALLLPTWLSLTIFGLWTRVKEEESMLKTKFGADWERWHARTARFVPGVF